MIIFSPGVIIGEGDRKCAPFLVLGLSPWYGKIFLLLEQIAPSLSAQASELMLEFSQLLRRGDGVRNSRNRFCFRHSRPQSLRSFWPAAGIESSGSKPEGSYALGARMAFCPKLNALSLWLLEICLSVSVVSCTVWVKTVPNFGMCRSITQKKN